MRVHDMANLAEIRVKKRERNRSDFFLNYIDPPFVCHDLPEDCLIFEVPLTV